jgi:hypothetical protein
MYSSEFLKVDVIFSMWNVEIDFKKNLKSIFVVFWPLNSIA